MTKRSGAACKEQFILHRDGAACKEQRSIAWHTLFQDPRPILYPEEKWVDLQAAEIYPIQSSAKVLEKQKLLPKTVNAVTKVLQIHWP
jgi:hypothetical protein